MKVSGKNANPASSAEAARLSKATTDGVVNSKKEGRAEAFSPAGSAKVELSQRAQDIKKAKELAMSKTDEVDEAKVARLQKMIDEGKYKVDAEAVADRLVDEHLLTNS